MTGASMAEGGQRGQSPRPQIVAEQKAPATLLLTCPSSFRKLLTPLIMIAKLQYLAITQKKRDCLKTYFYESIGNWKKNNASYSAVLDKPRSRKKGHTYQENSPLLCTFSSRYMSFPVFSVNGLFIFLKLLARIGLIKLKSH